MRRWLGRRPWARRLRARWALLWVGLRRVPEVPGPIHPLDPFFDPGLPEHYARSGAEGAALLARAADRLGREPARILDFGCGYGRVLRHLGRRWTGAEVVAADLDEEAVRFCRQGLGATPLLVGPRAAPGALHPCYDLIWAGSVFSHLPPELWGGRLRTLVECLAPCGQLVLTTHGPSCLEHPELYAVPLPVDRARLEEVGILHQPYPWARDYGVTVVTEAYVRQSLPEDAELIEVRARGWDGHQDVYWVARPD